jgi:carbon monoxide dehydrogenase subunit G
VAARPPPPPNPPGLPPPAGPTPPLGVSVTVEGMTTVSRTFTVTPSPAVVLDYLKDFSHAVEWDPGTESCTRIGTGLVGVGSRWHNTSKIAGVSTELVYELTELSDTHLKLVGSNDTATSTDTITVVPAGSGSEVTYEAVIEMKGAAKLTEPVVKLVFEKIGNDTEDDMTTVLNRLA